MPIELTQTEADRLINLEKHAIDQKPWSFPIEGESVHIPLVSVDKRENFLFDLYRARIDLKKIKFQNRAYSVIPLVRLDLAGRPHRNPDGTEIGCPHMHVYKEGYGAKWATEVPKDIFRNMDDIWNILEDFMNYCHITNTPNIIRDFFS